MKVALILSFLAFLVAAPLDYWDSGDSDPQFKKVVIDERFVAEGVAIGDINRDKKLDIVAGNFWYEAPSFKPHAIAPFEPVQPESAYSNCFNTWLADLNRDGWMDQIVIGMPGEKVIWRENPKGIDQPWIVHEICDSACNESPLFEDLFGNGKKVLIMGFDDKYVAWFEPTTNPNDPWQSHIVSELAGPGSQRYSHGLGVGDVNGDGRKDILAIEGYYQAPKNRFESPWPFIKADLGPECAQMYVADVNGDGLPDVLSTSAHSRGVWAHLQDPNGIFKKLTIDETISVSHSASMTTFGASRSLNLITGKRKWAHKPGVDVGSDEPDWLVRYELTDPKKGIWRRHIVDQDSGVGTQFDIRDVDNDGKEDIVTANKNGVFLFLQK